MADDIFDDLDWIVQCDYGSPGWESIAAFNSSIVAQKYIADCRDTSLRFLDDIFSYRLMARDANGGFVEITA